MRKAWCGVGLVVALAAFGADTVPVALGSIGSKYDPKTVVTVNGRIAEVKKVPLGKRRNCYSLLLEVQDAKGMLEAYLGPDSFLKRGGYLPEAGTPVVVTGSRVTVNGQVWLIVRDLKAGDRVIQIRRADGHHL